MKTLVFGEIIWDIFNDKREIGGAPFNFSAHLAQMGVPVSLISAVGEDSLGDRALELVRKFGVNDEFVVKNAFPTGVCNVTIDSGGPSYDIVMDSAYDNIIVDEHILNRVNEFDAFYFGTLAQRGEKSLETLKYILSCHTFKEVFCDINIRQNYYSRENVERCLNYATILKISSEESGVFKELDLTYSIPVYKDSPDYYMALCREIADRYRQVKIIIITLGKDGALVYDAENKEFISSETPKNRAVSTVGAGDSFSACFMYNYMNNKSIAECINRAVKLSDYIVTVLGAICNYPDEVKSEIL